MHAFFFNEKIVFLHFVLPAFCRAKLLTRTFVLENPTKALVLWDKIVLKEVTAGHGALSI